MRNGILGVFLIGLLCAGCGTEGASSRYPTVLDSAGVTIVDNGTLDLARDLLLSQTPALQIGVVEGAEEYQLFRVSDVRRLSDGGIAVADGGARQLRIYEPDGRHRVTAGGPGRGPSEFQYPSTLLLLPGDTIQVQDFMDRVYFAPDGSYVRREPMDRGAFAALWEGSGGFSEGGRWMGDGSYFAPVYERSQGPPAPGPLYRPQMTFTRISAELQTVDTLGVYGGILQQYVDAGDRPTSTVPPYATNTSWGLSAADGTVVAGDNAAPQLDRHPPDGSHMIVRWAATVESVTPSEVEDWKERQRNAEWTQDRLPMFERQWAVMDVPETKPYYGRIATGSDGTTWVGSAEAPQDSTSLRAFASDGHYLGIVTVPGWFTVYDSGPGWILGVFRDENNVEFIQLFELQPR